MNNYNHPDIRCGRCDKQIAECKCPPLENYPIASFIQNTLEADRKERAGRVENIIKELRGKGLYDDDLYAHFYRIIKGY